VCVCPNFFDLETSTRVCATEKSNDFVNMRLLSNLKAMLFGKSGSIE